MESRDWARGLNQFEFEHQFLRMFPFADVIPAVEEYTVGSDPEYHGINGVTGEFEPETDENGIPIVFDEKKMQPERNMKVKSYACRGCGAVFNYAIARAGHEKHCKHTIPGGN